MKARILRGRPSGAFSIPGQPIRERARVIGPGSAPTSFRRNSEAAAGDGKTPTPVVARPSLSQIMATGKVILGADSWAHSPYPIGPFRLTLPGEDLYLGADLPTNLKVPPNGGSRKIPLSAFFPAHSFVQFFIPGPGQCEHVLRPQTGRPFLPLLLALEKTSQFLGPVVRRGLAGVNLHREEIDPEVRDVDLSKVVVMFRGWNDIVSHRSLHPGEALLVMAETDVENTKGSLRLTEEKERREQSLPNGLLMFTCVIHFRGYTVPPEKTFAEIDLATATPAFQASVTAVVTNVAPPPEPGNLQRAAYQEFLAKHTAENIFLQDLLRERLDDRNRDYGLDCLAHDPEGNMVGVKPYFPDWRLFPFHINPGFPLVAGAANGTLAQDLLAAWAISTMQLPARAFAGYRLTAMNEITFRNGPFSPGYMAALKLVEPIIVANEPGKIRVRAKAIELRRVSDPNEAFMTSIKPVSVMVGPEIELPLT